MADILKFPMPMTYRDIVSALNERGDIAHVVVIIERTDGMSEVMYDRQAINQVVFAAAVLNAVSNEMASNAVADD